MEQAGAGGASNRAFELPLRIPYTAPRWLPLYIWLVHVFAVLSIMVADTGWQVRTILLGTLIISLAFSLNRVSASSGPVGIILSPDGRWTVIAGSGDKAPADLVSASVLLPEWIVLVLKLATGEKHAFLLTGGNTDKQALRRLRVRLYFPK